MEIIIPGDLNKAREKHLDIRTFICPDCECEWTANNEEYTWGSQLEPGPYMNCPCCGKRFVDAIQK